MEPLLACVEIEPPAPARASVVFLHGLGADGHDFPPILPYLGLPEDHGVRFLFPHAPAIPVTLNGGMVMPAWYDIRNLDLRRRHDEAGVRLSATRIERLIEREVARGVPHEHIVLAGFSQGGAIALHVGLRHTPRLAGILGLSTYLVLEETLEAERAPATGGLPVFLAHGTRDPMVSLDRGRAARDVLQGLGCSVEWHEFPIQHEVCLPEIQAMGRWLAPLLR